MTDTFAELRQVGADSPTGEFFRQARRPIARSEEFYAAIGELLATVDDHRVSRRLMAGDGYVSSGTDRVRHYRDVAEAVGADRGILERAEAADSESAGGVLA
ncbi:hypothetical protein AB0M12_15825 [Nocardia vinacea]|uniref:hypothetical protein n=1 Tax=Nocardia vinacea TaxID=96468 RepID=UPI0034233FAE